MGSRLTLLKGRTGLTPNILSRLAICLSLADTSMPKPQDDEDGQEFNRYTLTGEWDLLFISLLKQRLLQDDLDNTTDLLPQFKAHLNRGVLTLYTYVKTLTDLLDIIHSDASSQARSPLME